MLSTSVLVLNRLYQPVHVTSVRRALILLYRGAAKAVDENYQTFTFETWAELSAAVNEDAIGTIKTQGLQHPIFTQSNSNVLNVKAISGF